MQESDLDTHFAAVLTSRHFVRDKNFNLVVTQ
jgi:hypothetical protein